MEGTMISCSIFNPFNWAEIRFLIFAFVPILLCVLKVVCISSKEHSPLTATYIVDSCNMDTLSKEHTKITLNARVNRVGVTNAADRGLDMWANFGMAIQIKHLSLTEELAENIVSSVSSDRIVIVCKTSEEKLIVSLLTQIGWKSKIQSIITENDLILWYDKALRGTFADEIGDKILSTLYDEILLEFPAINHIDFDDFMHHRGYDSIPSTGIWQNTQQL